MLSKTLINIALLASSAMAAITFTSAPSTVEAGQTYTLKYSTEDTVTPISIILRKGDPKNLGVIGPLTTDATGGSFTWTAPTTLVSGTDYAFEIDQGTDVNYYGPFSVTGGAASVSSAATSASVSATGSVASVVLSSAHPSVSAKPSNYSNSTTTKTTLSTSLSTARLSTSSTGATATATRAPNSASSFSSPVALIFGAIAAMLYLQ